MKVTLRLYASHENGQALLSKDLDLALAPFVGLMVEGLTSQGAMTGVLDVHPVLMPPDKPHALRLPVVQIAISAQKGDIALQLASLSYRQSVMQSGSGQKLSWVDFLTMLSQDFPGWTCQPVPVAMPAQTSSRHNLSALDIVAGRIPCPVCGALADLWPSSGTWTCPACHNYWSAAREDVD